MPRDSARRAGRDRYPDTDTLRIVSSRLVLMAMDQLMRHDPGMDDEPFPRSDLVTIDDDVFGPGTDWQSNVGEFYDRDASWLLLSDDPQAAAAALHRVSNAFYSVSEDGRLLTPEQFEAETMGVEPGTEPYTPNYVGDVEVLPDGALIYVDTKSMLFPPMARTMMRLIIAELERTGTSARIARLDPGDERIGAGED